MTMQVRLPVQMVIDANGDPVIGAKVYVYDPGTTDLADIFTEPTLTTAADNPIICDNGIIPLRYLNQKYKIAVTTSGGDTVPGYGGDEIDPGQSLGVGLGTDTVPVVGGGTGAANAAGARSNLGAASQSEVTDLSATVSALSATVDTGLNGSDVFGALAELDEISRSELQTGFGAVILQAPVITFNTANTSINSATPAADTSVPQISEGTEIISQAFTPISASSTIILEASVHGGAASNSRVVASIHKTGTNDALACDQNAFGTNTSTRVNVLATEASGSTDARTYTVRVGGTFVLNTVDGTNDFGTALKSHLKITEILAI